MTKYRWTWMMRFELLVRCFASVAVGCMIAVLLCLVVAAIKPKPQTKPAEVLQPTVEIHYHLQEPNETPNP